MLLNLLIDPKKYSCWEGHTDNYLKIRFESPENLRGKFVEAIPIEIKKDYLLARLKGGVVNE